MFVGRKYRLFLASALLMCVVLLIIYPHYQYYIDPDGTAYLTIAQRYANGDYATAINGYWSPWSCWLTAVLIRQGVAAIPASVIINALGAIGFLFISQSFFSRFGLKPILQAGLSFALVVFLCYAVFWQSFDDLWECFFLLCTLRLMIVERFIDKPLLWVVCGSLGSLAYFAKAYAFPFFILDVLCCTFFLAKDNKLRWLRVSAVIIIVMLFGSHFWIIALLHKYGVLTTSTAGSLNMSWYLVGHPHWKQGIHLLIPPAYNGSPYYWEDPYLANGVTPHFWDSLHLFVRQIARIGYNAIKFVGSTLELSVFFPVLVVVALSFKRVQKRMAAPSVSLQITVISFLLFPLGFFLINFEARYIWYMLPLGMVIGGVFVQNRLPRSFVFILFPLSFMVYPIWGLAGMYDNGKEEYQVAMQLKEVCHGPFTGNGHPRVMSKIAYFSGLPYYSMTRQGNIDDDALLKDMRRYNVKYFLYLTEPNPFGANMTFNFIEPVDDHGKPFPNRTLKGADYVKILSVIP